MRGRASYTRVRHASGNDSEPDSFSIELILDADVDCHVMLYLLAEERIMKGGQFVYVAYKT